MQEPIFSPQIFSLHENWGFFLVKRSRFWRRKINGLQGNSFKTIFKLACTYRYEIESEFSPCASQNRSHFLKMILNERKWPKFYFNSWWIQRIILLVYLFKFDDVSFSMIFIKFLPLFVKPLYMRTHLLNFAGCLFDGKMYSSGEQIVIAHCLGAMTCLGNNVYGDLQQWG